MVPKYWTRPFIKRLCKKKITIDARQGVLRREGLVRLLQDLKYLHFKRLTKDQAKDDAVHTIDNQRELRPDFYSITFLGFQYRDDPNEILGIQDQEEMRNKELSEGEVQRNFVVCIMIYTF